ncbi:MAG: putative DNA binding domain-containing protein [Candidatus Aureabacteria bacterium]|nr:putative DNA binding domain-containing protein [Candidatus Auribacterota bacterium]
MTRLELLELIHNGENSGVEFKRDTIENHQLAKELVAFANHSGGKVLFGVDDDGTIIGLTRSKTEEWVMQACRDKIRPEVIPFFEILRDVEPGKSVAVIEVDRGWSVHHVWHNNHRTYFMRIGSTSREASQEELERLFQQRGAFRLEIRAVSGASLNDMDLRRLHDYFSRIRGQECPSSENLRAWEELLVNTELMIQESDRAIPTVAGLLLFGITPNKFLPQAGIDAVAYLGTEKDYAARERTHLRGPITPLLSEGGLVENGLVEQAIAFVRRNTTITAELRNGARREERFAYPDEAVREALVNAIAHRDYLLSATNIELSIYGDRIEIISPGRLPNGITPERMKAGCRAARNQLIKDVMRDFGYLEHMGMGVPRKIIKSMQEYNGTEPDLVEDGERFIVRLYERRG